MAYFTIEDFNSGLDGRRLEQATPAGALITLQNASINRGGEVEKIKDFVPLYQIPPGTAGLAAAKDDLYVFGSGGDPGVPAGLNYQKLVHDATTPNLIDILNYDIFNSKIFAVALFDDNTARAFYDGTIVAGLLAGSGTVFDGLEPGSGVRTFKNKMYICSGTNLLFSKIGDASIFDESATGSGLIDQTLEVSEEADIIGMQRYQDRLAVASGKNVSIWQVDPDPTKYQLDQVLENLSVVAARSMRSFGDHDLFSLTDTGVRSLRAVNSALSAGVDDVGTPVDDIILGAMDLLSDDSIKHGVSTIEPRTGRYLLSLGDTVYTFTYFARSKISAWSTWNPGVNMTDFVNVKNRIYARAGNTIYIYGGADNKTYTPNQVVVELPYLDARTLSTWKEWQGIDVIAQGVWDVYVNSNPNMPDYFVKIATITEHTIDKAKIGMAQHGPVLKIKFVHQGEGPAVLSKVVVHYKKEGRDD